MSKRILSLAVALASSSACDYQGDFLFPGELADTPGVIDFGVVEPIDKADWLDGALFGEVGPAAVGTQGGATVRFMGTGGAVCVWVDPEAVTWNTAVGASGNGSLAFPDNVFDDGDLDLSVGQAVYYNGMLEETVGDFQVGYQDELGNTIEIELNECVMFDRFGDAGGHAGRANAEFCSITNTIPNVEYIAALATWNTPLDDDRLSFGVLVVDGDCPALRRFTTVDPDNWKDECILRDEAREGGAIRDGYAEFETTFCTGEGSGLAAYCEIESATKDCAIDRCYCGDPTDLPDPA